MDVHICYVFYVFFWWRFGPRCAHCAIWLRMPSGLFTFFRTKRLSEDLRGKNFSQFSYSWLARWNCVLQESLKCGKVPGKRATYDTILKHVASVNTFCYQSPLSFVETPVLWVTPGSNSSRHCQQTQLWSRRSEIPALTHILEAIKEFCKPRQIATAHHAFYEPGNTPPSQPLQDPETIQPVDHVFNG